VIAMHPGVLECAVVGVPNAVSGEAVKAFVVRRDPALTEQELKAFVAERGLKVGQVVHPLRFALTGRTVGLGLYDALAILGRERSLARIRRCAAAAAG